MIRQVQVKELPQPVCVPVCIPDWDDVTPVGGRVTSERRGVAWTLQRLAGCLLPADIEIPDADER